MPDFIKYLESVSEKPGMYIAFNYGAFTALIYGYDEALEGKPLYGFKEWLVKKAGGWRSHSWCSIALIILNIDLPSYSTGPEELHLKAIRGLTGLLKEYYKEKDRYGIDKLMTDYKQWLEAQDWYDPEVDREFPPR